MANPLLLKIPHHRSPVILFQVDEKRWLSNDLPLAEVTNLLSPYPAELMNAYPIAPTIKNPMADDPGIIYPAGERLMPECDVHHSKDVRIEGMGSNKHYGFDELNPWGE